MADKVRGENLFRREYNILSNADKLITKRKKQVKAAKEAVDQLQLETQKVIENLTQEQTTDLLKRKWIDPLVDEISQLPQKAIAQFIAKIEAHSTKYKENLRENQRQLKTTQDELVALIQELTGNEWDMKGLEEFVKILKEG